MIYVARDPVVRNPVAPGSRTAIIVPAASENPSPCKADAGAPTPIRRLITSIWLMARVMYENDCLLKLVPDFPWAIVNRLLGFEVGENSNAGLKQSIAGRVISVVHVASPSSASLDADSSGRRQPPSTYRSDAQGGRDMPGRWRSCPERDRRMSPTGRFAD